MSFSRRRFAEASRNRGLTEQLRKPSHHDRRGAEQTAGVLTEIKAKQLARNGEQLSETELAAIREPILEGYRERSSAYCGANSTTSSNRGTYARKANFTTSQIRSSPRGRPR